jgi:hypothetical protein
LGKSLISSWVNSISSFFSAVVSCSGVSTELTSPSVKFEVRFIFCGFFFARNKGLTQKKPAMATHTITPITTNANVARFAAAELDGCERPEFFVSCPAVFLCFAI